MNVIAIKSLNSFAIDALARRIIVTHTEADLFNCCRQRTTPVIVLGGGSNVLFVENYAGALLLNRMLGLIVEEEANYWYLHIGAGEVWHYLVNKCFEKNIHGLENLSLLPGFVGSTPIHNLGAYGVELQQLCEYVDVLQVATGAKCRLNTLECKFGYRDSIFKHDLREQYVIVAVGLQLTKSWRPFLNGGDLSRFHAQHTTPHKIADAVCTIRHHKLPEPSIQGNAGSFFKNPVISCSLAKQLLSRYHELLHYPTTVGEVKLAAGWLIDRCWLKDYRLGGAAVPDTQALVLVNTSNYKVTGDDIVALARHVRRQVEELFGVWLEPEVRFIGINGDVNEVIVIE